MLLKCQKVYMGHRFQNSSESLFISILLFTLFSFVSDSFSTVQTGSLSVMFRGERNQDKGVD